MKEKLKVRLQFDENNSLWRLWVNEVQKCRIKPGGNNFVKLNILLNDYLIKDKSLEEEIKKIKDKQEDNLSKLMESLVLFKNEEDEEEDEEWEDSMGRRYLSRKNE
jgi:hypothetical protein